MPRNLKASENAKLARSRRAFALERSELRGESEPRVAPAGPTSMPVKARSASDDLLIEAYLKQRERGR